METETDYRKKMTRKIGERERGHKDIIWQTPADPPLLTDFSFCNGKRFVNPYYFEFISHVKVRWAGKTIVDFFSEEFKGRPYDYYVSAVESGRIQVEGQLVPVSYILQPSQKVSHFVHRHEPPVLAQEVLILVKEPEVITVCKPASVPVHPCGQYRKNTVVGILLAENGLGPLFPVHRLDRLVSGLLILARNANKADQFRKQIEAGKIQKKYIAKVTGVFPEEEVVHANVYYNAREGRSSVEVGNDKGKTASTKFTRISTNGTHSVVLCEPVTGRTHQIRVHLRHMGHPIANDLLYLFEEVACRSMRGTSADRAANASAPNCPCDDPILEVEEMAFDESLDVDPMCTNCPKLAPKGYEGNEEALWLHCIQYSGPDWSYECPYPDWASLEEVENPS